MRRVLPGREPFLAGERIDYADSFEVGRPSGETRSPEELARAGLEGAPVPLRLGILLVHVVVLGFRLRTGRSSDRVLGWQVVTSSDDLVILQAYSPMMRGLIVLRRDTGRRLGLSTYLCYRRPMLAAVVWRAVGPLHRRVAPYLVARAVGGQR